jgi:hypothetical protein
MKTIVLLIATLPLSGCITLNHTLSDGTRISATPDHVSVQSGKSVIVLDLPKK